MDIWEKNLSADRPLRPVTWTRYLLLGTAAGLLAAAAACGGAATPVPTATQAATPAALQAVTPAATHTATPPPAPSPTPALTRTPVIRAVVRVAEVDFPVDLAVKPEDRFQGLSGRASLDAGTGMLFVFGKAERLRFWMREMEFPLDIVWISAGCRVVDVSENVPAPEPGTPLADLPRYSPDAPAKYVLEINGGEAAALGLRIGDAVEFLDALEDLHGC